MNANLRRFDNSVSAAIDSWKWWPGVASWNAVTSDTVRLRPVAFTGFRKYVPGREPSSAASR